MLSYLSALALLFYEFFKAGLFAVGGGLATVPFIRDMGATYGWITETEIANVIAIAESTPGPIGVNAATYVGYLVAGIPGALLATLGLVTPSVIIIILVAKAIKKYSDSYLVQSLFRHVAHSLSDGHALLERCLAGVVGPRAGLSPTTRHQ